MLCIEQSKGHEYLVGGVDIGPHNLHNFAEVTLILAWRRRSSGAKNNAEWLARQEDFAHITLPRIQHVTHGTMQRMQRLDEGFDMEFQDVPRTPNPFYDQLDSLNT
ncbi:hypothetical protein SBOR_3884 [Sclerotinia borealis F-4128]|uniref:Uncharacterized protein n=1 Tax=Sclerotinia borealis (strain F-4128) TaxID=1432307 RepID=W9CMH6_SCLBF|nr:hypothetical protein SBOR_3884 [Sclerotinia borealis F-4128]